MAASPDKAAVNVALAPPRPCWGTRTVPVQQHMREDFNYVSFVAHEKEVRCSEQ